MEEPAAQFPPNHLLAPSGLRITFPPNHLLATSGLQCNSSGTCQTAHQSEVVYVPKESIFSLSPLLSSPRHICGD
ncbi:MAG: hypothetical protein HYW48_04100 [Deltaproteobacteria bacterium]|nr:hypothetical protein [Deltaproteobacteria bacterium]